MYRHMSNAKVTSFGGFRAIYGLQPIVISEAVKILNNSQPRGSIRANVSTEIKSKGGRYDVTCLQRPQKVHFLRSSCQIDFVVN